MSLIGLQSAVAAVIRLPRAKYEWKSEFLDTFDLTVPERRIVEKLSMHPEINKYGKGQAEGRFLVMTNHCDRVPNFLPPRVLKNLWFDLFEPVAVYTKSDLKGANESSIAFMNFLLENKDAQKRLKRCGPFFINDVIRFEIAELELSRALLEDPPLREGSLLAHNHFRVVDFKFNLPAWFASQGGEDEDPGKYEKDITLVFVKGEAMFPRIFEITSEVKVYLLGQLATGSAVDCPPEMQKDLQKMGLIASKTGKNLH